MLSKSETIEKTIFEKFYFNLEKKIKNVLKKSLSKKSYTALAFFFKDRKPNFYFCHITSPSLVAYILGPDS